MKSLAQFNAPWAMSLKVITILSAGLLTAIPVIGILYRGDNGILWLLGMVLLPLSILAVSALYMVRGYELAGDKLIVHRLGWQSEFNLRDLRSVRVNPKAMKRSIRTLGNGGLFGFVGRFRNPTLGPYRALATDPSLAVVLTFPDRVVVVTPESPQKFAAQLQGTLGAEA